MIFGKPPDRLQDTPDSDFRDLGNIKITIKKKKKATQTFTSAVPAAFFVFLFFPHTFVPLNLSKTLYS